jgi:hypothetical protein
MRRTDFDGDHREHDAMAAASANECSATDALVAEGCSFDAESANLCDERYARPRPCRRRALGPSTVSASRMTTPRFWTVSSTIADRAHRAPRTPLALYYPFLHAPHQMPFDGEQSAQAPQRGKRIGMLLIARDCIVHFTFQILLLEAPRYWIAVRGCNTSGPMH